jgi:DNA-binding response OmpR family regulator
MRAQNHCESLRGVKVLIVEDDPLLLMDVESTLAEAGAEVVGCCQTVDEALRHADPVDFAVAVLDFRLGDETASPIARRLEERGVPFVFYTGRARDELILAEWRHCHILEKPSPPCELIRAVKSVLPVELAS